MKVYYGKDRHWGHCDVTPKMLRQMALWDKGKIANVSLLVHPPGNGTYLLIHIANVHVAYSISMNDR